MTMTRTLVLNNTCIQYAPATPKSAVIILHDTPQCGTDKNLLENIAFIARLKNGTDNPNRLVLIPQLPTNQGGFWANTLQPIFDYLALNYPTLPIDWVGFGMGGGNIMTGMSTYGSKVRSACVIATGQYSDAANKAAFAKNVYSLLSYNGGDTVINNGAAIDDLENYLRAIPVANNVCWKQTQGGTPPNGTYGTHNNWDVLFTGIVGGSAPNNGYISTYWGWLDLNVDLDPAGFRVGPVPKRNVYVLGTKVWDGATQGDPTKVEIY
jgi:hypothetical protein